MTDASVPADTSSAELREANQELLLAGLREQEQAARANRAVRHLTALLETMTEGVTVFDGSGEVVLVNSVGRNILGCFRPGTATLEDYGCCDLRTLDRAPVDFKRDFVGRMLRGESFTEEELILVKPGGEERYLVLSGSAVREANEPVALAINVYRDVTELRVLEQLREQYVALMSHDLRGPLSAARMAAQLIDSELADAARRRAFSLRIVMNLDRMDDMIRDLLDFQRIRAGHGMNVTLEPCDLVAIARDVVEDLGTIHGDFCQLRGEPSLMGNWSADHLRRAIWNLATNAIKYGANGQPVVVTVERAGDRAVVSVQNQGPPIPPDELELVFRPFSRARSAAKSGKWGWGLGLTLVRGCAEAHGGSVSVTSDVERGTIFVLELPLSRP